MNKRTITRMAFLQSYEGMPEKLAPDLAEIARKGYAAVVLSALDDLTEVRKLCEQADKLGLEVALFTGYMKYDHKYLAQHPEQQMVYAEPEDDQDGMGMSGWGCPFNPILKERYFRRLREMAVFPGVTHISLNDEGFLGSGCYCAVCAKAYADEMGAPIPRRVPPKAEDWRDPQWRNYIDWKVKRWAAVHREMAQAIHEVNPRVRASFQSSPAVDLWMNPWYSGVDLAAMAQDLDYLSSDPYYTFHKRLFDPPEVYLSEWSRFLYGITPEGKEAAVVPQGFSHPTFTRPLGTEDGIWSAIVPPACGATIVGAYSYTLQRCSPVQASYESCFRFDPYFERTAPLKYAALVHGLRTEMFKYPLPMEVPYSFDGTRLFPVAEALRHGGVPYGFLPDAALRDDRALAGFQVVILPEIACASRDEREGLARFIRGGGNALILGELASADETGGAASRSLLEELFDARVGDVCRGVGRIRLTGNHPAAQKLQFADAEAARRYMDGTMAPLYALCHCHDATMPADAEVLAEFTDDADQPTGRPAIAVFRRHGGRVVWLAGVARRTTPNARYGTTVLNMAHQLVARLCEWAAGAKPALRVEDWPPMVPMRKLRPLDQRFMPTFEFFPLLGDDCALGIVTSYFKEPTMFPMVFTAPSGRRIKRVRELLSQADVPFELLENEARISVRLTFDTPALVFLFELE